MAIAFSGAMARGQTPPSPTPSRGISDADVRAIDGLPPLQEPNRTALGELLALARADAGGEAQAPAPSPALPAPAADWSRILENPASVRGARVQIHGRFAGRQRETPGPGQQLREWGLIATGPDAADLPVIVYLPASDDRPPAAGTALAGEARFLALWEDRNAAGEPARYPVLVSAGLAPVSPASPASSAANDARWMPRLIGLLVALSLVAWWLSRRLGGQRRARPSLRQRRRGPLPRESTRASERNAENDPHNLPNHPHAPPHHRPLPSDPAEALEWLADRQEKQAGSPPT